MNCYLSMSKLSILYIKMSVKSQNWQEFVTLAWWEIKENQPTTTNSRMYIRPLGIKVSSASLIQDHNNHGPKSTIKTNLNLG